MDSKVDKLTFTFGQNTPKTRTVATMKTQKFTVPVVLHQENESVGQPTGSGAVLFDNL